MPNHIFIIEDEEILAQALASSLQKNGYEASYELTGNAGQKKIEKNHSRYQLLILDWLLPDKSGLEICQELRAKKIDLPILLLTGKEGTENKVAALKGGADDYLTKPFALAELLARVRALGRRPRAALPETLRLGDLILDVGQKKVLSSGKEIRLTLKEFAILEYLLRHSEQVISREQIMDHVWDYDFDSFSNVVDVHMNNLRKKLAGGSDRLILETVRGVGYCAREKQK